MARWFWFAALLLALPLQAEPVADLKRFVRDTHSLSAEFDQAVVGRSSRQPRLSRGELMLSRPGRLRWVLSAPYAQLVVADGREVWVYDPDLKQATRRSLDGTLGASPAALLTDPQALNNDFELAAGHSALTPDLPLAWVVATPKKPGSGFERIRIGLREGAPERIELDDALGQTTVIRLINLARNPVLADNLFRFSPPPGSDVLHD